MDKKNLKFYETPAVETVEVELADHLLVVSQEGAHFPVVEDEDEDED